MKGMLDDPALWREAALIDGEWLATTPHGATPLRNPADGRTLAHLPSCREAETDRAIEAAHRAFLAWRRTTAHHRAGVLRRWFDLCVANRDDLARLIVLEEGKPLAEARGEVDYAASYLEWFAEEAKRVRGDTMASRVPSQRLLALRQPVGVCAAITPWNFPAAMITRKAGPALAAGCTMVLKPAPQTPLTALALAELALRAGVPAGGLNVLTGPDAEAIGARLTSHPLVRKLTFTGSTAVGRRLLAQAAGTIKRCSMELGGNAPAIVFDDADLDVAVAGVMASKYRNTGQACISVNRVLVQDSVHDAFAARLAEKASALKVGEGFEEGVAQGPLITPAALEKVEGHVADALAAGARVVTGGARHPRGGLFYQPTVLADVPLSARIAREETFGPVAALFRFSHDEDAIAAANDTEFGLAAYVFSRDAARVWRAAEGLEAGMVGVNTGAISSEIAPFGGIKQSGIGREGSHLGMDEYLDVKFVCWDGLG